MEYAAPVFVHLRRIIIYLQKVFLCWWYHCVWYLFAKNINGLHQLIVHFNPYFLFLSRPQIHNWESVILSPVYSQISKVFIEEIDDNSDKLWVFMADFISVQITIDVALFSIYCFIFHVMAIWLFFNPWLARILAKSS